MKTILKRYEKEPFLFFLKGEPCEVIKLYTESTLFFDMLTIETEWEHVNCLIFNSSDSFKEWNELINQKTPIHINKGVLNKKVKTNVRFRKKKRNP